jgi:Ca-activated chloride channel homolog
MEVLRFENQDYFYLLTLLPIFLFLFLLSITLRKRSMKKLGQLNLVSKMIPMRSTRRPWLKFTFFVFAFGSLAIAAVNPQIGFKTEEARREGVDIVIALDVSRSMLAEDIRPNRMDRAKLAVSRLIDRLGNDRVGIVVFAGSAVTQVPITSDHQAAKMILRTVNTNSVQVQGTAIGTAIERSMGAFLDQDMKSKVIILVSDGENHQDDPLPVVQKARNEGIVIHTVGVGTQQGAPIPIYRNNQLAGFVRDNDDKTVISRFDEAMLRSIAQAGGGIFQTSTGPDMGLNRILDEIRDMEQQEFETVRFSEYESRFHYFIAFALIFLVLEVIIFERKSKWLNRIKFFETNNFNGR